MNISDRIKIALDMSGLQMKDLAIKVGIPFSTLSDIVTGKRKKLDVQKARDISKALNCPLDYLVGEDCYYQDDADSGRIYSSALEDERKTANFSIEDLAAETKIPASLLKAYEEGLAPISEFLLKAICDVYGKSIHQFLSDNDMYDEYIPEIFEGDVDRYEAFKKARDEDGMREAWVGDPAVDAQPSANTDLSSIPSIEPYNPTMVPIVGTIAAGTPILAEENIEGYAPLQDRHADFALTIKGDSMIGDNIHPGDIVFIKQQPTIEIGEIAAVLIDGEATLKHFYRDGDAVTLVSSNTKYKPMIYHKGDCDDIRILGKAIAYLHDLE